MYKGAGLGKSILERDKDLCIVRGHSNIDSSFPFATNNTI